MGPRSCLAVLVLLSLANPSSAQLDPVVVLAPREAGLIPRPWLETPASRTVVPREVLDDRQARGVLGVIGDDASVGENYAPLGYYEALSIRGFVLDNASGYKRDGLTLANESSQPLENKERVEVLKGPDALAGGLAAPGGTINYVVKRPAPMRSLEYAYSENGTRYVHADWGGRTGLFGWRFNAAREDYHPYVKEAVGHREFASAFFDWRLPGGVLAELDADWQRKSQLSVPGYQALGGNTLPPGVRPETMLNNQPWSAPVAITASDLGGRLLWEDLSISFNRNRLVSDDVAAFPFGCSSGPAPLTTFCANGDYDLYDYRSLGEVRVAEHSQALWRKEGGWGEAAAGVSRFRRTVDLGQYVYDFVGTANIYDASARIFAPSPNAPGSVHRNQDYREEAAFARGSWAFSQRWRLDGGLRWSWISDDHWDLATGVPFSSDRRKILSPQGALLFFPAPEWTAYGAYSEGLELGGVAPPTTANAGRIFNPKVSRQVEAGVKRQEPGGLALAAAAFAIKKPLEFTGPDNVFRQQGTVRHAGLEFSASGRAAPGLRLLAGATLINARQEGTGTPDFDGKAPVNVPCLRSQVAADYAPAFARGWALSAAAAFVSRKYAARDDSFWVPGYARFDLGLKYVRSLGRAAAALRLRVENVLDTVYWKDTGEYFGDGYLHLGAPRLLKLDVRLDF